MRRKKQDTFTEEEWLALPLCEAEGCSHKAPFRAPKVPGRREYYNFCLDHVREYNAGWNYYHEMGGEDVDENVRLDMIWRRPTWSFGNKAKVNSPYEIEDPLNVAGFTGHIRPKGRGMVALNRSEQQALKRLNLSYPFTREQLKAAYIKMVKKHHPDVNKGCKRSEERLKKASEAYDVLNKFLKSGTFDAN